MKRLSIVLLALLVIQALFLAPEAEAVVIWNSDSTVYYDSGDTVKTFDCKAVVIFEGKGVYCFLKEPDAVGPPRSESADIWIPQHNILRIYKQE